MYTKEVSGMKKRLRYVILPIITVFLETLPYGAVLNFGRPASDGSIGYFRELYSYFDLMPCGYGNFTPLLTAVITCILLLMLMVYSITGKKKLVVISRNLLCIDVIVSLGPLMLGIKFFSLVGALITGTLIAELCLLQILIKSFEDML